MKKHLKDYFIPHAGNDYQPHSLQKTALLGMTVLVLLSFIATNAQALLWSSSDWLVTTILPAVIVDLTNEERDDDSLRSLQRNAILDAAATLKAQHMAAEGYFSHFAPDGTSPWYWFNSVDYNFVHAGENLAIHFDDSDEVVDAWMDSPTHRANILNGNYTEIGVGTAKGKFEGYNTVFVVQLFATPAAEVAEVVVENVVTETAVETEEVSTEPLVVETVALAPAPEVVPVEETVVDTTDVLAESVAITESIDIVEPQPEPIVVTNIVTTEDISLVSEAKDSTETTGEIVQETASATPIAVYSDFVSTSTGGVPATVQSEPTITPETSVTFVSIATRPELILQVLYSILALFIVGALLLSILLELQRQQPVQIAYSLALLMLMYGLFKLHITLNGGALIV